MHNGKSILLVEDASLVRLYYRSILEPAGYQVSEALNGVEALEKLAAASFDLLIVDVNMPLMDGFTLLDTLRREQSPRAGLPALITSTESADHDFAAARAAGANHYLVKPIEPQVLLDFATLLCGVPR